MKNLRFLLLLFSIFVIVFSCKEEEPDIQKQTEVYCAENMIFSCNEIPMGDVYFKGKINCKSFCISYPENDYWYQNGIGTEATTSTSDPVLNPNTPLNSTKYSFSIDPPIFDNYIGITKDFQPGVQIYTPSTPFDSIIPPPTYYLDKFVQEGDLPLINSNTDKFNGWHFDISWSCVFLPGYDYYKNKNESYVPAIGKYLSPSGGTQNDLIFNLKEVIIERDGNISTYYITFEIECDLYYYQGENNGEYFGRLDDGEFRTKIVIEN
jgi:hypothetical protein